MIADILTFTSVYCTMSQQALMMLFTGVSEEDTSIVNDYEWTVICQALTFDMERARYDLIRWYWPYQPPRFVDHHSSDVNREVLTEVITFNDARWVSVGSTVISLILGAVCTNNGIAPS